jgi:hypothetical protein
MKIILSLLFALSLISCSNQKETQILKTNSKTISIKDGDGFYKDIWEFLCCFFYLNLYLNRIKLIAHTSPLPHESFRVVTPIFKSTTALNKTLKNRSKKAFMS